MKVGRMEQIDLQIQQAERELRDLQMEEDEVRRENVWDFALLDRIYAVKWRLASLRATKWRLQQRA